MEQCLGRLCPHGNAEAYVKFVNAGKETLGQVGSKDLGCIRTLLSHTHTHTHTHTDIWGQPR